MAKGRGPCPSSCSHLTRPRRPCASAQVVAFAGASALTQGTPASSQGGVAPLRESRRYPHVSAVSPARLPAAPAVATPVAGAGA
eukprot:9466087-Pyramimonas_sp.AAC.1